MKDLKQKLIIEQMDKKLDAFKPLLESQVPERGWIHAIRTSFKMSYRQFARRLGKRVSSAKSIEEREMEGGVTLKALSEAGRALNMKLVYGFIPMEGSIKNTIEQRAKELAIEIVKTTSNTMALEDQKNTNERLKKAIEDKAEQLASDMPRYLWN